ncbi:MAG: hypothetical protein KDI83_03315 [Gammaproteobacteria bacterium]|nr:hypothetical protein [Gammaproteobacteria bacterium]
MLISSVESTAHGYADVMNSMTTARITGGLARAISADEPGCRLSHNLLRPLFPWLTVTTALSLDGVTCCSTSSVDGLVRYFSVKKYSKNRHFAVNSLG